MRTNEFAPDKIVGAIILLLSLCGTCLGIGLTGLGAAVGIGGVTGGLASGQPEIAGGSAIGAGVLGVVGVVIAALYGINIVAAIGIMKGVRWGFVLGAVLTGLATLTSLSGADGFLSVLPSAASCAYCVLRLTGKIGPRVE
jgi:hypothetical protein